MLTLLVSIVLLALQQSEWAKLAPLPDKEGFASPFAGVIAGKLVVAGGANFPDKNLGKVA